MPATRAANPLRPGGTDRLADAAATDRERSTGRPGVGAELRVVAILLSVALASRGLQFGNPLVHADDQFYLLGGQRLLDGALPYVDFWDRKPIGLFLLYAPFAALGDGVLAYQLGATLFAAAAAWFIVLAARHLASRRAATWAGVLYLCSLLLVGGDGGQSPVFYNAFVAGAGLLVLRAIGSDDPAILLRRGLAAMLLVGLAIQIKYTPAFEGMFFGCMLIAAHWRRFGFTARLVSHAVAWCVVALAPTALAIGFYTAAGHGEQFIQANFLSIFLREEHFPEKLPGRFAVLALLLSPICAAAAVGLRRTGDAAGKAAVAVRFVGLWLMVAILAVVGFGSWYDHYGLPILVPGAIAAAACFDGDRRQRRLAFAALAIGVAVGGFEVADHRAIHGNGGDLAPFVRAIGDRPPGCLYVHDGPSVLYVLTRSCLPTRFVFPNHLSKLSEDKALGVARDAELRRIFARRPKFVMLRDPPGGTIHPGNRALVMAYLGRSYDRVLHRPLGRQWFALYRRRR